MRKYNSLFVCSHCVDWGIGGCRNQNCNSSIINRQELFVGWLVIRLVGWLVLGWLVSWLVDGWLVLFPQYSQKNSFGMDNFGHSLECSKLSCVNHSGQSILPPWGWFFFQGIQNEAGVPSWSHTKVPSPSASMAPSQDLSLTVAGKVSGTQTERSQVRIVEWTH